MPITQNGVELTVAISEKAADKIKYFAEKDGISENVGIHVAVKGGGCSGLTYDLKITGETAFSETDKVVEQHGVKVVVDKKKLHLPRRYRVGLLRRSERQGLRLRESQRQESLRLWHLI